MSGAEDVLGEVEEVGESIEENIEENMDELPHTMKWVYTTCELKDKELLRRWAEQALREGWAFCVQLPPTPLTSYYQWQGQMHQSAEAGVIFKTTAAHVRQLVAWLATVHPYDTPGIWVFDAQIAHPGYYQWAVGGGEQLLS